MKNLFFASFFLLGLSLTAQDKHDYIWLLGQTPNKPESNFGGSKIDFKESPATTSFFEIPIQFMAIAVISDANGQLRMYTNGCQIISHNHALMANGDSINPGIYNTVYCSNGYPLAQGMLLLPYPGDNERYILFHFRREDTGEMKNLLYTLVNMNTPDGLGIVEKTKNQPLVTDYMADMLTAVRHGNGRDWWVLAPKTDSGQGYLFLLTPTGIEGPFIRQMGQYWDYRGYNGHSVFSPDGSKYVRANPFNGIRVATFDRCAGTFANEKTLPLESDTEICGVAISPNSQYLYVSTGFKLFQYNLNVGNISASKTLVGEYDGFMSPFKTTFYQPMLAPDNKIYMTCTNSNNILHIIHTPDEAGLDCNFEQHGLILPTLHAFMAPNFPHFRLYDLPGSPCDTLGIDGPMVSAPEPTPPAPDLLHLYPNPATDEVLVSLHQPMEGRWQLVTPSGQVVRAGLWSVTQTTQRIDVSRLSAGVYFFRFVAESGRVVSTRKVVVAR